MRNRKNFFSIQKCLLTSITIERWNKKKKIWGFLMSLTLCEWKRGEKTLAGWSPVIGQLSIWAIYLSLPKYLKAFHDFNLYNISTLSLKIKRFQSSSEILHWTKRNYLNIRFPVSIRAKMLIFLCFYIF